MTIEEAISYLESQGFTIRKNGKLYLITDTQATPPDTFSYDNPADLIAEAQDLKQEAQTSGYSWWNPAWGPFPVDKWGRPDTATAITIAKYMGGQVDEGQALQKAIAQGQQDIVKASAPGQEQELARLIAHQADLKARYDSYRQGIQPKTPPPSGAFKTQAEAVAKAASMGAGYEPAYDPATGQWYVQQKAVQEPVEQFLGTVEDGGWRIDQYGYTDASGKRVVTKRQPRQPIKDPVQSLDDMIALALKDVDFNDPNWAQDADYLRAQSLRAFQKQPTAQERLQTALQIAQSPSDYLTLTALYVGAISRETPAKVGERIAPLAPFLQELAKQFFLDIPGITQPPPEAPPVQGLPPELQAQKDKNALEGVIPPDVVKGRQDGTYQPQPLPSTTSPGYAPGLLPGMTTPAGVIDPATVEAINAGTYQPEPFPGEIPHIPTYAETGLPPELEAARNAGNLTPEQVQAIKDADTKALQGQYNASAWGESLATPSSSSGTYEPQPLPGGKEASPKVTLEDLSAYHDIFKQRMAEGKKKKESLPSFQQGGYVPGYLGQPKVIQAEGGEVVMTPEQVNALLQQSGMFGPVYRPGLQQLPEFLTRPRTTTLAQLTGGALRPRSLQTIRNQSPTQRMLTLGVAQSFGVPQEDFLDEERMATSVGGPRRMARFSPGTIRTR